MSNSIISGSIFLVLALIGCQTVGNDDPLPDLKNLIPNTTWYSTVPDSSQIYTKFHFGNLNSDLKYSIHNFPCGSRATDTLSGSYSIKDSHILSMTFIYITPAYSEHELIEFANGKLIIEKMDDGYQSIFLNNCSDF